MCISIILFLQKKIVCQAILFISLAQTQLTTSVDKNKTDTMIKQTKENQ